MSSLIAEANSKRGSRIKQDYDINVKVTHGEVALMKTRLRQKCQSHGEVATMLKQTISHNPQRANSIVERVHQIIGNIMRTFQVPDNDNVEDDDPWLSFFSAIMAAVRCTYSTTAEATPMQLVFGQDFAVNITFAADWDCIQQRKQPRINENNVRRSVKLVACTYHVDDQLGKKQINHKIWMLKI